METFKVVVAEDERLTRERIVSLITNYPKFEVVAAAPDGAKTLNAIQYYRPDVLMLDIKMPIMDAFTILEQLSADDYGILVFITAYDQYAIQAFEQEALDYLLKPFNLTRFEQLMFRLETQLHRLHQSQDRYLNLKVDEAFYRINIKKIIYIKSDNNHVQIYLENRDFRKRTPISVLLDQLGAPFIRIHRSYIINPQKIIKMEHIDHGDYLFTMVNGKKIPSSRSYRDAVKLIIK